MRNTAVAVAVALEALEEMETQPRADRAGTEPVSTESHTAAVAVAAPGDLRQEAAKADRADRVAAEMVRGKTRRRL